MWMWMGLKAGERDCGQQEALAKGEPRVNTDDKTVTEAVVFWKPFSLNKTAITVFSEYSWKVLSLLLSIQDALALVLLACNCGGWLFLKSSPTLANIEQGL